MSDSIPPTVRHLYPFKSHYFETAEGKLNYVDQGDGPAVVMIHGNPTWSFLYRDLIQHLSPFYRCLALDHLGCGLSDKPEDGQHYDLTQHVRRTVKWLTAMELKSFVLIVHDWGGPIGLGAVAQFAEQLKGIIVTNTAGFPFKRIPKRIAACRIPGLGTLSVQGLNSFVRAAKYMTTVKPLSPVERLGYSFPYNSWDNRIAINRFVQDIPMCPSHPSYAELLRIEGSLKLWQNIPVFLHWGMKDWCFHPVLIPEWKKRIPHIKIREYAHAGHYLFEDQPKEIFQKISSDLSDAFGRS